ncbi:MAG TPA: hypothetical protein VGB70_04725 [Allosphingosinicella sp.]
MFRIPPFALAAALLACPLSAQEVPTSACPAEKAALQAERNALRTAVSDIATGRWHKINRTKRKLSGGDAAKAAGGAAASVLLPFPFGLAVNAATSAGGRKGKGDELAPGTVEPDVAALIARQQAVETRLAELGGC